MSDYPKNASRPRQRIRVEDLEAQEPELTSTPAKPEPDTGGTQEKPGWRRSRRRGSERVSSGGEYEVGYGRPPKEHRFAPGRSGNPNGRPKGQCNAITLIREIFMRPVKISRNGKQVVVPSYLVAYEQLMQKAMRGDPRAMTELHKLGRDLGIVAPEPMETDEAPQALNESDLRAYASLQIDLLRNGGLEDVAIAKALTAQGLGSFVAEFLRPGEERCDEE